MIETFSWRAQVETAGNTEFVMASAKFGDGYAQEVPLGINNERKRWTVVVADYGHATRPMLDWLRARQGQGFLWRAPNTSAPAMYKCKRFSESDQGGDYWTISMGFEQA